MSRILLLFVDGIGLAPAGPDNPFSTVPTPALAALAGGPLTRERVGAAGGRGLVAALDATLGVDGLPQSATGQTTLFTGVNAAALLGRHVTAFPGPRLRRVIEEHGLLARAGGRGLAATFANAFTPGYFERVAARRRRHSATTLTALAAGLPLRGLEELRRGEAVSWDVERDRFGRSGEVEVPPVEAAEAGCHLAAIAGRNHLTLYETFLTDMAGHRRFGLTAAEALRRLDGLVAGLVSALPGDLTVLVTSDHGNLEEAGHTLHTRNPVPLLALGPAARRFAELTSIVEVAPAILGALPAAVSEA